MKDRGGNSVLVSGKSGSIWAWWLLEDRGWTEGTSPTTARSVWWAKNTSGTRPLLESSEWLSVSNRETILGQRQPMLHRHPHDSRVHHTIFNSSGVLHTKCVCYLCCCHPHCPCSLVLGVEGWMESCSFLMMFHQRYLDQNLHLQQHQWSNSRQVKLYIMLRLNVCLIT